MRAVIRLLSHTSSKAEYFFKLKDNYLLFHFMGYVC
jgi:hypothetical protein